MRLQARSGTWIAVSALSTAVIVSTALADRPMRDKRTPAAPRVDFTRQVQPLLAKHCLGCHGPQRQMGGLRFDSRAGAVRSGDSGQPAIVPGHSEKSRLIRLVTSRTPGERMPPQGNPLTEGEVALLRAWIDQGAPFAVTDGQAPPMPNAQRPTPNAAWWSFQSLARVQPPPVRNSAWVKTPVDRFILAALEEQGLTPAAPVDRRKLIRRAYFDLIGLPPKPEEIEAFVRDPDPKAYEKLVDRLLDSPHYGERWGRHWLDVARYADSNGQEGDQDRPTAYHYRDFVIRAFNQDLPYDTFVRWQLAGDEYAQQDSDAYRMAITATGFITAGPHTVLNVPMEEEKIRNRFNELDDMISTTGSAFLGLTVGCARCHDHKYDPIPTRDYYRMLSAFNGGDRAEVPLVSPSEAAKWRQAEQAWKTELEAAQKELSGWLSEQTKPLVQRVREAKIDALPVTPEQKALLKSSPEDARARELARKHGKALKIEDADYRPFLTDAQRARWDTLAARVKAVESRRPAAPPTALAMADFGPQPRPTHLLDRGDFHLKKEPVELGFLSALTRGKPASAYWSEARGQGIRKDTTYQRRALAEWMTDMQHGAGALVARVMVNRVWQHHFGEGLVRTINDFGLQGEAPSHPELLEYLASVFTGTGTVPETQGSKSPAEPSRYGFAQRRGAGALVNQNGYGLAERRGARVKGAGESQTSRTAAGAGSRGSDYALRNTQYAFVPSPQPPTPGPAEGLGWSIKRLHRLLMTSAVYQQGTAFDARKAKVDPDNRLLWRRRPRRIEGEILRDAMLAVSGSLDPKLYGPAFKTPIPPEAIQARNLKDPYPKNLQDGPENHRRTVYMFHKRVVQAPLMQAFDGPDAAASCGRRSITTVAPQALALLNEPFVRLRATDFARRLRKEAGADPAMQVRLAFRLALGREPSETERENSLRFLEQQTQQRASREKNAADAPELALTDFAQVIFGLNEFMYVD